MPWSSKTASSAWSAWSATSSSFASGHIWMESGDPAPGHVGTLIEALDELVWKLLQFFVYKLYFRDNTSKSLFTFTFFCCTVFHYITILFYVLQLKYNLQAKKFDLFQTSSLRASKRVPTCLRWSGWRRRRRWRPPDPGHGTSGRSRVRIRACGYSIRSSWRAGLENPTISCF